MKATKSFASIALGAVVAMVIAGCSASPSPSPTPAASSSTAPAPTQGGIKPTVVLVHGAWADNSSWDGEVAELQKEGYDARAISNPLKDLTTDAESVKGFLATLKGPIVEVRLVDTPSGVQGTHLILRQGQQMIEVFVGPTVSE